MSTVVENVLVAPQGKIPRCCNIAVRCAEGNHEDSKCPSDDLWNKVKTLLTEHFIQKKECQTSLQEVMETSQWLVNTSISRKSDISSGCGNNKFHFFKLGK